MLNKDQIKQQILQYLSLSTTELRIIYSRRDGYDYIVPDNLPRTYMITDLLIRDFGLEAIRNHTEQEHYNTLIFTV